MRFLNAPVILAACFALIFNSNALKAAEERTISGRLIFENSTFSCEQQCVVTLLAMGVRPVQTVFAGFGGQFAFSNVPRGEYTIKIDIDGIGTVSHAIRDYDAGFSVNIFIPLARQSASAPATVSSTGTHVVDITELPEQYPKKAVSFFEKGRKSLKKNKTSEAVQYLESAVQLAPNFYAAHNQLGVAYRAAGRVDDAEREFVRANEINAKGLEPLLNLTALYLERTEHEKALKIAEQAVQADSHSALAFFNLGAALYHVSQMEQSETALKRALDLAPKMAEVRLMLANVYVKLNQYDNTLEQLNIYIAENPKGAKLQEAVEMRDQLMHARAAGLP
jgi:tetratricopeptide (TPR) repeat protein